MPILAAFAVPHQPIMLPQIGRGEDRKMQKTLDGMAALPGGMPPEAFARFVTQESKNWNSLAADFAASKQ